MLLFSKPSKVLALSFVGLMLLAGATIRPAAAIVSINPTPTFTLTGTPAVVGVTYAVVHNGNLWVSDYGRAQVNEYAAPYTANEAPILTLSVAIPSQLAFDSAGNLWVGTFGADVYEYDSPITNGASPSVTLTGFDEGTGVTLNGGNLWVFDWEAGSVYNFAPEPTSYVATPAAILTSGSPIEGVFDSSGNLWTVNYEGDSATEFASPIHLGEVASNTLSLNPTGNPTTIAMDGAGNLWVGSESPGFIDEFAAPISHAEAGVSQVTISSTDSVWGVSVDPSGNLWVGDFIDSGVYEFSGLAAATSSLSQYPTSLPPVIPTTLPFQFTSTGTSPVVGKLVAVEGGGIVYNLPGYTPAKGVSSYSISICYAASQDAMRVSGFGNYQAGFNSTEILVSNYFNFLTSAQGWPTEPACTT